MVAQPLLDPPPLRIAVLDDDIRFIRYVERALRMDGFAVQPVTTLDMVEAHRVIVTTACDAALVDLYMYGAAAGFDFIERLRNHELTARLPLALTTGARREIGRRVEFLQSHRCSVLLKPFGPDELAALIRELCPVAGSSMRVVQ